MLGIPNLPRLDFLTLRFRHFPSWWKSRRCLWKPQQRPVRAASGMSPICCEIASWVPGPELDTTFDWRYCRRQQIPVREHFCCAILWPGQLLLHHPSHCRITSRVFQPCRAAGFLWQGNPLSELRRIYQESCWERTLAWRDGWLRCWSLSEETDKSSRGMARASLTETNARKKKKIERIKDVGNFMVCCILNAEIKSVSLMNCKLVWRAKTVCSLRAIYMCLSPPIACNLNLSNQP